MHILSYAANLFVDINLFFRNKQRVHTQNYAYTTFVYQLKLIHLQEKTLFRPQTLTAAVVIEIIQQNITRFSKD